MIPIVIITGKSGSGKTTLITKLIQELNTQGFRVATIKHCEKEFEIDKKGKDSWKHTQAGAEIVVLSSRTKLALIKKQTQLPTLDEICNLISNVDIIFVEGYKKENKPMIEVVGESDKPLFKKDNLIAIVSKDKIDFPHCFHPDDIEGIARFIRKTCINNGKDDSDLKSDVF